jgi:hypothetical protein
VIGVSDEDVPGFSLFLEMAFQAEGRVAFVEQPLIDGAVWRMAYHTALTHCLVLVNKWAALRGVALEASFVSAQESEATTFERLLNICRRAFNRNPDMRVVTIGAAHFAFQYRMTVRQLELCPHFQVTLETSLRRLTWIDNRVRRASAFYVQTAGSVARLTANILRVLSFCLQSRVRRCSEIARDFIVTRVTTF